MNPVLPILSKAKAKQDSLNQEVDTLLAAYRSGDGTEFRRLCEITSSQGALFCESLWSAFDPEPALFKREPDKRASWGIPSQEVLDGLKFLTALPDIKQIVLMGAGVDDVPEQKGYDFHPPVGGLFEATVRDYLAKKFPAIQVILTDYRPHKEKGIRELNWNSPAAIDEFKSLTPPDYPPPAVVMSWAPGCNHRETAQVDDKFFAYLQSRCHVLQIGAFQREGVGRWLTGSKLMAVARASDHAIMMKPGDCVFNCQGVCLTKPFALE